MSRGGRRHISDALRRVLSSSRSNTILTISQEWLVRLMWNEKAVHWLDTGYNMWPGSLTSLVTLTLDVSRSNLEKALYHRNCWSDWCEMKRKLVDMILGRLYDLALWPHPWPCPCSFKVRVWNSFISGMGQPIDNDRKGCESSIHDHDIDLCDRGGMYRIVTRVTSDVSVPSAYLVYLCLIIKHFDVEN